MLAKAKSAAVGAVLALTMTLALPPAFGAEPAAAGIQDTSIAERFLAADEARDRHDYPLAERRYRQLIAETDGELRVEARFRLAVMLDSQRHPREAAAELRAILTEKPDAQGIRLMMARMLAQAGDGEAARQQARQVEASGLPPELQPVVRRFVDALRSSKPVGGSLSVAAVADSNVNRATRSETLETVIAPFQLSQDAQAQSGAGASISGQFYGRVPLASGLRLLGRISGQADLYDKSQFNDVRGGGQIGLEWVAPGDRFAPAVGRSYRWFGGARYVTTDTLSLGWRHKLGALAALETTLALGKADYAQNDALDGAVYDLSLRLEKPLSALHGVILGASVQRQDAADRGYATTSGGIDALYWRQAGAFTLYGSLGLQRLRADERLLLFARKRSDRLVTVTAGASLTRISVAGFSPFLRASYVRNGSSVGLYDYEKARIEAGLSRAL